MQRSEERGSNSSEGVLIPVGTSTSPHFVDMTPHSFLRRAARVFPERISVRYWNRNWTWGETYERASRTSSALISKGFARGETVSVLAENIPALYELHFSIPMSWCVLSAINYRLDAATVAYELNHSEAKLIFADVALSKLMKEALSLLGRKIEVIWITDPEVEFEISPSDETYESFVRSGEFRDTFPIRNENDAISINYTSWTTGKPKGVIYTHRGAYLNAMGNALAWNMGNFPVYLWTLPMFHCNGWCFPWTLAAVAWTSVCMRKMNAKNVYSAISEWKVTHFCWAPIVANTLIHASEDERRPFSHPVSLMLAAAPPPLATIRAMEKMGITITHAYGLTETYGPAACCAWHPEWDALPEEERWWHAANAWVPYQVLEGLEVMDVTTGEILPHDGKSEGEIVFRGNIVTKGYLKDEAATEKAFEYWWFHTWDIWKIHPNGYLQVSDRLKDIIISWGENIASIEVENALCLHPSVKEAAVVAKADSKWWEVPCAFVSVKDGHSPTETELIAFCREKIAHYKIPKYVVFGPIERTSTGKTQKFVLREKAGAIPEKTA